MTEKEAEQPASTRTGVLLPSESRKRTSPRPRQRRLGFGSKMSPSATAAADQSTIKTTLASPLPGNCQTLSQASLSQIWPASKPASPKVAGEELPSQRLGRFRRCRRSSSTRRTRLTRRRSKPCSNSGSQTGPLSSSREKMRSETSDHSSRSGRPPMSELPRLGFTSSKANSRAPPHCPLL